MGVVIPLEIDLQIDVVDQIYKSWVLEIALWFVSKYKLSSFFAKFLLNFPS